MKKYINPKKEDWEVLMTRPHVSVNELQPLVEGVFDAISSSGNIAVKEFTELFDFVKLDELSVNVEDIETAGTQIQSDLKEAILVAAKNIETFHKSQCAEKNKIETTPGVTCWQETRAIESIGIYIPGGTAPLFSTVLMLGIPAKIAGCKEVVLCTPPDNDGNINPAIRFAAALVGIKTIYKVGGIQAIAAMTYGTETIPKVFKIFGPGNQYVTAAKQFAQQLGVAIDMPAGPSELVVMADQTANLNYVAADLLSQAEHGEDSQVIAVLSDLDKTDLLIEAVSEQLEALPRADLARKALENSRIIVLSALQDRVDFVNLYAPEHLIIAENNPESILDQIVNAGSVFLGNYTPESAGDYASGTNHTLPTNGFATSYSGVNLDAFIKKITVQYITENGIKGLGRTIELMAEAELLQAHKNAVTIRLKDLES